RLVVPLEGDGVTGGQAGLKGPQLGGPVLAAGGQRPAVGGKRPPEPPAARPLRRPPGTAAGPRPRADLGALSRRRPQPAGGGNGHRPDGARGRLREGLPWAVVPVPELNGPVFPHTDQELPVRGERQHVDGAVVRRDLLRVAVAAQAPPGDGPPFPP